MKPLILSFFLVILAYSLFLDKKEEPQEITPVNINSQTIHLNFIDNTENTDSTVLFAQQIVYPMILKNS
ncbi:hypothetical protein M2480_002307 [Parabacteroides sp. PFB2-12]|uniref:hypothetical protein n=1 Tax=unclassified Parabacteroides TaxID=2649774 RepID=UPI0024732712|nr:MULTISPECIES: hypothetical protein [unclassified Parabacteroides]MDH6343676.1 hypothetical protein [Parabacteroides sp. PM6-13]MDH6391312.1 hypothetical protein [Parabacteroides sp. PFB2-12]